jgi:hypothetical protein
LVSTVPLQRIGCSPELPGYKVSRGVAVLVVVFKVFGHNFLLRIDETDAGIRIALGKGAGSESSGTVVCCRPAKFLGQRDRIITERCYTESVVADCLEILFQLDKLDFAERSPIRGTEEHESWPLSDP